MARKLLALLLLLFAMPATAAVYTGTTSAAGRLDIPIPTGPGRYLLSFQLGASPPPFDLTVFTQGHFTQYFVDTGENVGGDDVDSLDTHSYYTPTRSGSVGWEVAQPYTTIDATYRTDYYFNGVGAYFDFYGESGTSVTYAVDVTSVPEPAQWALLIAGFGFAGAALRRRPRAAVGAMPAG